MTIRRKTRTRILIVLAVLLILGGAAGGFYLFRQKQLDDQALDSLARGRAALEEGRPGKALTLLRRYLRRNEEDALVLQEYAKALKEYSRSGAKEMQQAIACLRRALTIQPALPGADSELLVLYELVGYNQEAIDLANEVLEDEPADPGALWALCVSYSRQGEYKEAKVWAERLTKAAPDDRKGYFQLISLMGAAEDPPERIIEAARKFAEARAADPVFQLLLGNAYVIAKDTDVAREILLPLAESTEPLVDLEYAAKLISVLDLLKEPESSTKVMQKATVEFDDPRMLIALVSRLWQKGAYQEVLTRLEGFSVENEDLLAYALGQKAMSLVMLQQYEGVPEVTRELQALEISPIAKSWLRFLQVYGGPRGDRRARDLIDASLSALKLNPNNSVFHYFLGDAYEEVGETQLAIKSWSDATRTSQNWTDPILRAARRLVLSGYAYHAEGLVKIARERRADDENIDKTEELVVLALAGSGDREAQAKFLEGVTGSGDEDDMAKVPLRIYLTAKDRKPESLAKATEILRAALDSGREMSPRVYLSLALLSEGFVLGLEKECLQAFEESHGPTADLVYYRAARLWLQNKGEEGLQLLLDGKQGAPPESARGWEMAIAQYKDRIDHPEATETWAGLGDAYPEDVQVQGAIASSKHAWEDSQAIGRLVERLKEITGETGLQWRIAKAKLQIKEGSTDEEVAEAAALLDEVLIVAPQLMDLRLLLGLALERLGDTDGAIRQLTLASKGPWVSPPLELLLARLLTTQNDFGTARERLERVLTARRPDPDDRTSTVPVATAEELEAVADLLSMQGEYARATEALELIPAGAADLRGNRRLLYARMLAQSGRAQEAEDELDKLLEAPDADILLFAIGFYATHGRIEEADRLLDRLPEFEIPLARRAFLEAEYYRITGRTVRAEEKYSEAMQLDPELDAAPRRMLSMIASLGDSRVMIQALGRMAEGVNSKKHVTHLLAHEEKVRFATEQPRVRGLLMEWIDSPALETVNSSLIDAFRAQVAGELEPRVFVYRLSTLADENPRLWGVQSICAQALGEVGQLEEAIRIARRSVSTFPALEAPREQLAGLLLAAKQLDEALTVAKQWREKTQTRQLAADLTISRIYLALAQFQQVLSTLDPHMRAEVAPGDEGLIREIQFNYGKSLMALGRHDEARELFVPLCRQTPVWRMLVTDLVVRHVDNDRVAVDWLEAIDDVTPRANANELLALARGFNLLFGRTDDPKLKAKAAALIEEVKTNPDLSGPIWMMLGMYQETSGDNFEAVQSYRKALRLQPALSIAKNNLAVLLSKRGEMEEALALAKENVTEFPENAEYRDTLAIVYKAAGRVEEAIRELEKARELEPLETRWKITQAEYLVEADRMQEARLLVGEVQVAINSGLVLPPVLQIRWETLQSKVR